MLRQATTCPRNITSGYSIPYRCCVRLQLALEILRQATVYPINVASRHGVPCKSYTYVLSLFFMYFAYLLLEVASAINRRQLTGR